MGFAIYMLGMLLFIGAIVYGARQVGLSDTWVGIISVALLGIGVMGGIVKARRQDPSVPALSWFFSILSSRSEIRARDPSASIVWDRRPLRRSRCALRSAVARWEFLGRCRPGVPARRRHAVRPSLCRRLVDPGT